MKKLFTILIMLCTTLGMSAANYDIYVKGVQVTDANRSDVLGDGKVRFQTSNNMLIFTNANYTYNGSVVEIGASFSDEIILNFEGASTFKANGSHCINHCGTGKLKFYANSYDNGSLTIKSISSGYLGIDIYNDVNVEISGMTINAEGEFAAIGTHLAPKNQVLTVKKSTLTLKSSQAALRFKNVVLEDCKYVSGYAVDGFNSSGYGTYGGTVKTEVRIVPIDYNLDVDGIHVTSQNAGNIFVGTSKSGKANYNSATNTLTIDGATFNEIYTKPGMTKDFTIDVKGTCNATNASTAALYLDNKSNTTITSTDGTGVLNATTTSTNANYGAIKVYESGKQLTIKNCTVNAKGGYWGIAGYNGDEKLLIDDTTGKTKVTCTGTYCALGNFASVSLNGVDYVTPDGAYYNTPNKVLRDNTAAIAKSCEIAVKNYQIYIMGEQLTSKTVKTICNKYPGLSFNPVYYELTLNGVNMSTSSYSGSCIFINHPAKIVLKGTNKVTNNNNRAITADYNTIIEGDGTLYVTSSGNSGDTDNPYHALCSRYNANITINNCHIIADASSAYAARAIASNVKGSSELIINGATVEAKGYNNFAGIGGFKKLTLEGNVGIEVPTRGTYNSSLWFVGDKTGNFASAYVKVAPIETIPGLKIVDKEVTNIIAGDILDDGGTVSYDRDTNILTLYRATVGNTTSTTNAISWTGSGTLNINLKGGESVINSSKNGIYVNSTGGVKIYGGSDLLTINTSTTSDYAPINVNTGTVNIDYTILYLNGNKYGIKSNASGYNTVGINSSAVGVSTASGGAAISGFKTVNLLDAEINSNSKGILCDKSMNVNLEGSSQIWANEHGIFASCATSDKLNITGSGSDDLYINSKNDGYGGIMSGAELYIKNASLTVHGNNYGLYGQSGRESLTIENSTVIASSTESGSNVSTSINTSRRGAIVRFEHFALKDSHFDNGEVYSITEYGAKENEAATTYANYVKIVPGAAGIEAVTLDEDANVPAYDLRGVQVDKSYKGVVIKNGRKYMQK